MAREPRGMQGECNKKTRINIFVCQQEIIFIMTTRINIILWQQELISILNNKNLYF